ncbi:MAG: hypothetical protein V1899_11190 [Planctomycetota bacterium]
MGMKPNGNSAYNWDPKNDSSAIIEKLKTIEDIRPDSIYLAGFSAGGSMVYVIALDNPDAFAYDYFKKQGFRVMLKEFQGGHTLPTDYVNVIKEAVQWFHKKSKTQ